MTPGVVDLAADATLLTVGIGVLYFGAEWLVRGAARLAASLGVSPIVVGLTIVSFGTSAPTRTPSSSSHRSRRRCFPSPCASPGGAAPT